MTIAEGSRYNVLDSGRVATALRAAVDPDFYSFAYPDLPLGIVAAEHYATNGWREGRDPNTWFSTSAYLSEYPEVGEAGTVPLFHYLIEGRRTGHSAKPSVHAAAYFRRGASARREPDASPEAPAQRDAGPSVHDVMNAIRSEFDTRYYEAVYPDVVAAGIDALEHFSKQGWREGRDPNAWFSVKGYLHAHPDVADAEINPFYHYVVAGRSEGRVIKHDLGFRYDVLAAQGPLAERIAAARSSMAPAELMPPRLLQAAFDSFDRSGGRRIHISISHDDYSEVSGGVQLCIRREATRLAEMGVDHVHLFPAYPSLFTSSNDADAVVGILVNGVRVGTFDLRVASEVIAEAIARHLMPDTSLAVHSLLGHNVPRLMEFLECAGVTSGYFWVHDYGSVCASHTLLRNDVEFCGAPSAKSQACGICVYSEQRQIQVEQHAQMFDRFPMTVIAPSEFALETWVRSTNLQYRDAVAHSHCKLVPQPLSYSGLDSGPLRVAFLGHPNAHKGWPLFKKLAIEFSRDDRYRFYHLGQGEQVGLPITFKPVCVEDDGGAAMIQAVTEEAIDVALILSLWPETFCFTAHEAAAGGAVVLTTEQSGNVARIATQLSQGLVLPDERAVYEAFSSGETLRLKRGVRPVETFELEYSNMTADFISLVSA